MNNNIFEIICLSVAAVSAASGFWMLIDPYSLATHIPGFCFAVVAIVFIYYIRLLRKEGYESPNKMVASAKCRKNLNSPLVKIGQIMLIGLFILNVTSLDGEVVNRLKQHPFMFSIAVAVFTYILSGLFSREPEINQ